MTQGLSFGRGRGESTLTAARDSGTIRARVLESRSRSSAVSRSTSSQRSVWISFSRQSVIIGNRMAVRAERFYGPSASISFSTWPSRWNSSSITFLDKRCRTPWKTRFRLAGCAIVGRESNPLDRYERFQMRAQPEIVLQPDTAVALPGRWRGNFRNDNGIVALDRIVGQPRSPSHLGVGLVHGGVVNANRHFIRQRFALGRCRENRVRKRSKHVCPRSCVRGALWPLGDDSAAGKFVARWPSGCSIALTINPSADIRMEFGVGADPRPAAGPMVPRSVPHIRRSRVFDGGIPGLSLPHS